MIRLLFLSSILLFISGYSENKAYYNPGDTVSVEIEMDNFSFEPSTIEIPVDKIIKLRFINVGSAEHEFMAGHNITEGNDGYSENLFDKVKVQKFKNGKLISDEEHNEGHGTEIILNPDESGSLVFKLPASKKGEWDMGCFINLGGGTHYQMGMNGKIIVK